MIVPLGSCRVMSSKVVNLTYELGLCTRTNSIVSEKTFQSKLNHSLTILQYYEIIDLYHYLQSKCKVRGRLEGQVYLVEHAYFLNEVYTQ